MKRLDNFYKAVYKGVKFNLSSNYKNLVTEDSMYISWGFSIYKTISQVVYIKAITPDQLESAYEVENHCIYKGKEFETGGFNEDLQAFGFDLRGTDRATAKMFGLTDEVLDEYYGSNGFLDGNMWARNPDNEILDVWEIRKPIEGFPFKGPEKVWVKKDGVWLR